MRVLEVSKAIIAKEFTVTLRYKIQLISGFIFLLVTLIGLVIGGNSLLGNAVSGQTSLSLVSGFMLFFITNLCIGTPTSECTTATHEGNMETISMFSISLSSYLSLQTFFKMLANIGVFIAVTIVASVILKIDFISLDMIVLFPLYLVALLGGLGLGLILAGLQLLYKRVGYIISLATIGVSLALAVSPRTNSVFIELIPMKAFATIFKDVCIDKTAPELNSVLLVIASSIIFYSIGKVVFNTMLKKAKIKGCLGGY